MSCSPARSRTARRAVEQAERTNKRQVAENPQTYPVQFRIVDKDQYLRRR